MNFWQQLKKPIFVLAPMEAVTDFAFREIFAKYGKPDVMFTEFINVDGLTHKEGFEKLKIDLKFSNNQRPIVAQIWGRDPEKFYKAACIIADMKFDGIDINFGCPQDKEIAQKTCAALIREPNLAGEIIEAVINGSAGLPVSVKTRIGYSKTDEMQDWISHLLKYPISALTLHARTKQEKSKVPAHWEKIKEAVSIRDKDKKTLIIGNGDIKSREEGLERIKETGCDGVMIARGAFGNPWLFRQDNYKPTLKDRFEVLLEHAKLFTDTFKDQKSFFVMRKNFKAYASGFEGASELRLKLMQVENMNQTEQILNNFLKN